jgi:hypothetical protein
MNIQEKLQAPFPAEEIEFRVQSCGISNDRPWAMVLAYVQARAIQKRLDDVFGWDGWQDEYRSQNNNTICRLGVKSNGEWIWKENGASETQVEAFKGGISASLKRVAASGYGIGRYLYNLTESFAECVIEKPKNMVGWNKAQTKERKTIYWKTPTLPDWALPKNEGVELVKQLIGEITQIKKVNQNHTIAALKKKIGTTKDINSYTPEEVAKAIEILNEAKKDIAS